ncbi:AMP-binding protein [Chryseobacterium sp.]|uniref:AMP-binding protein n=1 Tax=Chryseobacterium sp. TaxID=1871047 RepID=UPI0012A90AD3|nr:AMP-binding protein [Chryseobacterium sp.]QFG54438.1 AMP-binding protein [Chryseobacterium sp.]
MTVDFNTFNMNNLNPESDFEKKVVSFIRDWQSPSETVKVQTSGSTGVPKVLEVEKIRMRWSAQMTCGFLGLKQGDSALICLPVEYISGKMMVVRALEAELKLHVVNPSSKPLQDWNEPVDFCAMSPLQVENSLDKLHLIKNLIIGGAQVSELLRRKISSSLPDSEYTRIFETYGMSETLSHIALKQIFPKAAEYFTVIEGVTVSQNSRGCLIINAPQLNPTLLQTNDVIELLGENQFKFIGRADSIINSGGLKIQPEQVEGIIKKYVDSEAVVTGVSDDLLGQRLVLAFEGRETVELHSGLVKAYDEIRAALSKNHVPREIRFISSFPRLPNGKTDRRSIKNLMNDADGKGF